MSTILFLRLPFPKESIIRLVFSNTQVGKGFCVRQRVILNLETYLENKINWKYDLKIGDTYGLDYQVLIAIAVSQA